MSSAASRCGALILLVAGSALAEPAAPPADSPPTEEEQTFALLETLGQMLEEHAPGDDVVVLEAEEIRVIAEEFLAEGDAEIATDLLEEAIALLVPREQE